MNSRRFSADAHFSHAEREEMRFLRQLKGRLREEIAQRVRSGSVTQGQLAERAGIDPAQLSRALSIHHHTSTRTLFRIAYALDRRWAFQLEELRPRPDAMAHRSNVAPTTTPHSSPVQVPQSPKSGARHLKSHAGKAEVHLFGTAA